MTKKDYVELSNQKLNYYVSNDSTIPPSNDFFKQYEECFNRLPCGICRLTNMPCPKITNYEPKITYNHIGDSVDTKTTNHITSDDIPYVEGYLKVPTERFVIVTDRYEYTCFSFEQLDVKMKEIIDNHKYYIIRYYFKDEFQGAYTNYDELIKKLYKEEIEEGIEEK